MPIFNCQGCGIPIIDRDLCAECEHQQLQSSLHGPPPADSLVAKVREVADRTKRPNDEGPS